MAEKERAKHAFGSSDRVLESIANGVIDSYDILFLDGDTDNPKIGWVDRNGNPVILRDEKADLSGIEAEVAELETKLAAKVGADEVDAKIADALDNLDVEVEVGKDYEVSHKPDGVLVDYRDKEIRILCPTDTQWTLQNSGEGADKNAYYIGVKAYAPSDDVVSFKEDLAEIISDNEMYYFEGNDFAGIDENGKYSIVWLPVAKYDGSVWTYHGANSTASHYVGWYYTVEWYNAEGKVVASDCIRINLSNEDCHSVAVPYYVGEMEKKIETSIEEKIAKIETKIEQSESSYEIIEF